MNDKLKLFGSLLLHQVSEPINNTVIVEWDILASNGIIHAIQSPLKVPLQHNQVSYQFLFLRNDLFCIPSICYNEDLSIIL